MGNEVDLRERARQAFERRSWQEAYDALTAAEADGVALGGDELELLGTCAWLLGEAAADPLGRACETFEASGAVHDAARAALDLVSYHAMLGQMGQAMGWARRAERLLEDAPEGPGHARAQILQGLLALFGGKISVALEHVNAAHALAREHGDQDAEAMALSRRAGLRNRLGELEAASADVDEAMLLVHRDRTRPITGAMIYCGTIQVCRDSGDFERALEWTEAASHWISKREVCGFPGICRVHRAELLRIRGEHRRAEAELDEAMAIFEKHRVRIGMGEALAERGLTHLETDALEDAERAFAEAEELGEESALGMGLLALRRGDPAGARVTLEGALETRKGNPLGRAKLLPAYVEACVETNDLEAARAASAELGAMARRMGTVGLQAPAETAAARVHLAAGEEREAVRAAKAATRAWAIVGARYELARAREVLAAAYQAAGNTARAEVERERARTGRRALSSSAATIHAQPNEDAPDAPLPETLDGEAIPPSLMESLPLREGSTLDGKIALGGVLGIGGMGIVHAGEHLVTGRPVAVKVLKRSACGGARECDRFLAEARACGRIRHPNVVDIYDAGMQGDEPYIVMERLEGRSLEDALAAGETFEPDRALAICAAAARGVAAAHATRIVHRDLKPGNIFLSDRGVKVLDFGISKQPDRVETSPDAIVGTPFYMAPEQIQRPDAVDARTDLWALGAVLFELLAGEPPFTAESVPALLFAIARGDMPTLDVSERALPAVVDEILGRTLVRDPEARYSSAEALAQALESAAATATA